MWGVPAAVEGSGWEVRHCTVLWVLNTGTQGAVGQPEGTLCVGTAVGLA